MASDIIAPMDESVVDRLDFSPLFGDDSKFHVYLDKRYQGIVWRTAEGWNVNAFDVFASELRSSDEAIELVRMQVRRLQQ